MSAENEKQVSYEQLEELENDFEEVELEIRESILTNFCRRLPVQYWQDVH